MILPKDSPLVVLPDLPTELPNITRLRSNSLPPQLQIKPIRMHTLNKSVYFEPLQEAWVYMRKGENSVFKRFYCVFYSNESLFFYNNDTLSFVEMEISLSSIQSCVPTHKDNGLKLVTLSNDSIYLNLPSKEQLKVWLKLIENLISN